MGARELGKCLPVWGAGVHMLLRKLLHDTVGQLIDPIHRSPLALLYPIARHSAEPDVVIWLSFSNQILHALTRSFSSDLDSFGIGRPVTITRLPCNHRKARCERMGAAWNLRVSFSAVLPILRHSLGLFRRRSRRLGRVRVNDSSRGSSSSRPATRRKRTSMEGQSSTLDRSSYFDMSFGRIYLACIRHEISAGAGIRGVL